MIYVDYFKVIFSSFYASSAVTDLSLNCGDMWFFVFFQQH